MRKYNTLIIDYSIKITKYYIILYAFAVLECLTQISNYANYIKQLIDNSIARSIVDRRDLFERNRVGP